MTLKTQHIFHLSSDDSKKSHANNSNHDFIVELGQNLSLKGNWSVEITEFRCMLTNSSVTKNIHIYCDLCEHSYCGGRYSPILRRIPVAKAKRIEKAFIQTYPLKVITTQLQCIQFFITGDDNKQVSFTKEPVRLTLRLLNHDTNVCT